MKRSRFRTLLSFLPLALLWACMTGEEGGGGKRRLDLHLTPATADSLGRMDRVEVLIYTDSLDPKTLYRGAVDAPEDLKNLPLPPGFPKSYTVEVKGLDAEGRLRLHRRLVFQDGVNTQVHLGILPSEPGPVDSLQAPEVTGPELDTTGRPTWKWKSGGGMKQYRFWFESPDPPTGTNETVAEVFSWPDNSLAGNRTLTLYVQEKTASGQWGPIGNFTTRVDRERPSKPVFTPGLAPLTPQRNFTWTWNGGGGGNGQFQVMLDAPEKLAAQAPSVEKTFTGSNLAEGRHRLVVRERDEAGLWSDTASFEIMVDATAPVLTLTVPNPGFHSLGFPYAPPQKGMEVKAVDSRQGDLSARISVTSTVNPEIPGNYTEAFTVKDDAGNQAFVERKVRVYGWELLTTLAGEFHELRVDRSKSIIVRYSHLNLTKWVHNKGWYDPQNLETPIYRSTQGSFSMDKKGDVWSFTSTRYHESFMQNLTAETPPIIGGPEMPHDAIIGADGFIVFHSLGLFPDKVYPIITRWSPNSNYKEIDTVTFEKELLDFGSEDLVRQGEDLYVIGIGTDSVRSRKVGRSGSTKFITRGKLVESAANEEKIYVLSKTADRFQLFEGSDNQWSSDLLQNEPFAADTSGLVDLAATDCGVHLLVKKRKPQSSLEIYRKGKPGWEKLPAIRSPALPNFSPDSDSISMARVDCRDKEAYAAVSQKSATYFFKLLGF